MTTITLDRHRLRELKKQREHENTHTHTHTHTHKLKRQQKKKKKKQKETKNETTASWLVASKNACGGGWLCGWRTCVSTWWRNNLCIHACKSVWMCVCGTQKKQSWTSNPWSTLQSHVRGGWTGEEGIGECVNVRKREREGVLECRGYKNMCHGQTRCDTQAMITNNWSVHRPINAARFNKTS